MKPIEKFYLFLAIITVIGLFLGPRRFLRYITPFCIIPPLAAHLNETQELCSHAEEIDAIQPGSDERTSLDSLADQFAETRLESNLARGPYRQLRAIVLRGLTFRLFVFYIRLQIIKANLELAIDRQQLHTAESATTTSVPVPSPAAVTATPANDAVEPTLPVPALLPGRDRYNVQQAV